MVFIGLNIVQKIFQDHLVEGNLVAGEEIALRVDQTLTQDATGTMALLQFEALGMPQVKVPLAVNYVDHNMLQASFENADDHVFIQTFSEKHGMYFSKPGNGICHQVNLERFAKPGGIMVGSDSHTPTSGAAGMIAIGVGGLDVAIAMGGGPYHLKMPKVVGVELKGKPGDWITGKDVILEMLRRLTVKGGVGKIFQYYGDGIKHFKVPERSTICNMGAELGATTSLFPSDAITKEYFSQQDRVKDWKALAPDKDATYDEHIVIDLSELEPLIACPGAPDAVKKVKDVEGIEARQVIIGSCTNSTFKDLMTAAHTLKGKKVHPRVSMSINPGSRQVFETVAKHGAVQMFLEAGARINESACLGCIGMGQAPGTNMVSVRSFNRNWPGRSGTQNDLIYLTSPETCVATAIFGKITDPRKLGKYPKIKWPKKFVIDDSMIIPPAKKPETVDIIRGPNIKPLPLNTPLTSTLKGKVLIRVGDNVSTDAIMPAGAKILPFRSNIPAISEYVFTYVDADFVKRAKENNGGFIVGGENYGQGSSREHAALAPMYLGVKAVFAKSFARIHKDNLINFGIIPLEFANPNDYDVLTQGKEIILENVKEKLLARSSTIDILVDGKKIVVTHTLTKRNIDVLVEGGLLNYTKMKSSKAIPVKVKR